MPQWSIATRDDRRRRLSPTQPRLARWTGWYIPPVIAPRPGQGWEWLPVTQPPGLRVYSYAPVQLPFGFGTNYVISGSSPAASLFAGQPVFGDPSRLIVSELAEGTPAAVDQWLGLAPGTTQYGAGTGIIWGMTGQFAAPTDGGVLACLANLVQYCGIVYEFIFPTGETFAYSAWRARRSCRMLTQEITTDPNGIQTTTGQYTLNFWLVVRDLGI